MAAEVGGPERKGRQIICNHYYFQATFEGWMEVMEDAIDATKVGNIYLCFVFSGLGFRPIPISQSNTI